MRHTHLWVAAVILASMILASFVFLVPHTHDGAAILKPATALPPIPKVALRDVFRKGTHTITGSLDVPNVCTLVTVDVSLTSATSTTQSILIAIAMPKDSGICLQEPSSVNFSTTIAAPQDTPLRVTINGALATTTTL